METLEQKRARDAWEKCTKCNNDKYVNLAKSLPALIMNSGLMQVMAFLQEKELEHRKVAEHLRDWLHKMCKTPIKFQDFMEHLIKTEPRDYQAISAEAFAWLKWLRQMAAAHRAVSKDKD